MSVSARSPTRTPGLTVKLLRAPPPSRWGIRFNHGGGYQYRLCPASEPLTEACFVNNPLEFNRSAQQLQWNNGTRLSIPGTWIDTGTVGPRLFSSRAPACRWRHLTRQSRPIYSICYAPMLRTAVSWICAESCGLDLGEEPHPQD